MRPGRSELLRVSAVLLRAADQDHEGGEDGQVVDQEVGTSGGAGCREDP